MAKQEGKDKLKNIYDYVAENYSEAPTDYETFKRFMADEAYASKIHSALVADEDVEITKDYNAFADSYGLKKKAVSPTSATSAKPTSPIGGEEPRRTSNIASGEEPKRRIPAPSTELPSDATQTVSPVEQLLPAQKAQREQERKAKTQEVEQKAFETVKRLKDIQFKKNNNIPIDPKTVPTRDELQQVDIDLEGASVGSEADRQLVKQALGDTGQGKFDDTLSRINRAAYGVIPDALNTLSIIEDKWNEFIGEESIVPYGLTEASIDSRQFLERLTPQNKYYDEDISSIISTGIGQAIPQLAAAYATGGLSAGTNLTQQSLSAATKIPSGYLIRNATKEFAKKVSSPSSLVASNTVFQQTLKEAQELGKGQDSAMDAALLNAGFTAITSFIPLDNILRSVDGIGEKPLKKFLLDIPTSGIAEWAQEGVEKFYNNLTAKETYDATRKLTQGVLDEANGGFAVGAFLNTVLGVPALLRKKAYQNKDQRLLAEVEKLEEAIKKARIIAEKKGQTSKIDNANENLVKLSQAKEEIFKNWGKTKILGVTDSNGKIIKEENYRYNENGDLITDAKELYPLIALERINNANITDVNSVIESIDQVVDTISDKQKSSKKIIRRKRAGEKDTFVEVDATYQNQDNERDASEQEQNLIKEGVISIDTTQQPVEEAPVEDPIQTAQTILNTADTSGGPVTAIQVGQAADAITKAVDAIEGKAPQPTVEPTPSPIEQAVADEGISTEPITDGERPTRTLEGIYVTPETDAQILYQSNKGGTLLKQPDGSLTAVGNQSVKELLQEAAENDPVIFDNGRSVEVDMNNITSEQEMFDALMQSDNPIDIADAYTYAEGMPSEVISNAGSREQALTELVLTLTPEEIQQYGDKPEDFSGWLWNRLKNNKKTATSGSIDTNAMDYNGYEFTPADVIEHLDTLARMGKDQGQRQLNEWLSDEEIEVNTARDEAAQRFQELTGAKLTPELARTIANSNPRQEQTVYGQDEEGNLLFSEPRTQVDKGEIAPETDKFRGLTKRQVNQRKVKDKITKRAEAFAQEKLDKYQEDNSDANLKEAVNALVKLFKQTSPVKKYKNSTVANFVEERIGNVGVELGIKIEKLTNEALNPKPKDRFDPTLTGKKKTTKQVLGIPINPVLQRLIDIGKVVVNYKPYSNDQGFADAKEFIRDSSMQEILDYLDAKNFEDKYTFVAKLMEDHFLDLMAIATSKSEIATLEELYAQVSNNRKIALNQAGRVLQSGKIFKGATDTEEELDVTRLRLENAKKLKERFAAKDKADGIELAQAEAKRIVDEEQANLAKDLEMAKKDALLEAYKQALAKVRRQLGQKELENKGLRSTTPETAEELEREINKLNKVIIEQANKTKKAPSTTSKAKETTTKEKIQATKTRAKEIEQKITSAFADGKLFDKTVARGSILPFRVPVLSSEGDALIREYVKVKAKELGFKVQAIAESLYSILPQELKDISTAKDWERIVAEIEGEAYEETVGAGIDALNERIDKDVQERILKGDQKPKDAVEDVIAELYKIYREKTIASDRKPIQPKTANELIAELLSQGEQAKTVWTEVQNEIFKKYGKEQKVLEALAEYFAETPLKLPVSKKKVKQAVREYFQNRGATLEELIRDRVRIEKETGANSRQAILALMPDLPIDLVNDIVNAIETETEAQAKVTADRIIDRYFDDTVTSNREPKPIQVQILSDIALANYADKGRVIEGINRKYGTDIRTEEELTDLEVALDNATTPTQVREALTDFARWTPEGAKLAGRVTKTEANRIGEAENNTGLDPVSLTLKALHDVAKQNKTVEAATKKEPNNVIDTMRAVLDMQNKGDAALIWETAKAIVNRELEAKFANDPEGLANAKQQIAEYFGHTPLEMAIPKKDFAKAVNQKLKELLKGKTVEQAIMDYDNIQEQVNVSVTEMLTDGMGLDPSIAAEIATQVENATQERINRAAQNIAKRLQPKLPKAKAARTPLAVRIAQALALKGKGVTDEEINKIIEERYGVFIPESALNGLEIAAKEAAVAFKEGGATSTAYKAAAQRFEIELAKVTEDNKWQKANTITSASLLSGPVGRIADVISNIALTTIELLKTGAEIPINLKKADWKRWNAKLKFARAVGQGASQGSKIAKLQMQGKITDVNRYTADAARNIEALIVQSTGLPKLYLQGGKWVYRIMAATDSLFTSEIAYQKALFDLLIATNENAANMSVDEIVKDALDKMYGNADNVNNAAFKAYVETFGQAPASTKQAEIDQEAKTAKGGDKDIYQARKLEILQNDIDDSIKNEARRVANIQAYKGEQFGTLGLLSDKITEFGKGYYLLQNITRFSGTAFKIMNLMADYSIYGFVRASGFGIANTFLKPQLKSTSGRVLGTRTQVDPDQKLTPEAKKAIEKAYRKQQLGRAIVGTLLGSLIPALFASLGDDDDPRENYYDIIGNMDAYPRQYRELLKQAGVKPNSLKIGNVYISFEYILPLAFNFAITANGKDLQRAARKLKEAYPEKYKDVTDESVNTFYEYAITQYTNPKPIASTLNTTISQSPLRGFSQGISTIGDIMAKEAEVEDLIIEAAKGLYKGFTGMVIPKITADFEKYSAIGLEKLGLIDVGAMALNNDKDFWVTIAYMSSLGDVATGLGMINPKRKIDAFGNIFEKEPNEYRMPVKVFERKFATEPIIQLQIESGVIKMPAKSAKYITAKKGKEVTETELTEREVYDMNLEAGKEAKASYLLSYIQEDMALLKTDRAKAVERIKKTSSAVLEYARLKYLYNKFVKGNSTIPTNVQKFQLSEIYKAEAKIKKARK
jgi:hypothetical protein